jgi:hypothetical protein
VMLLTASWRFKEWMKGLKSGPLGKRWPPSPPSHKPHVWEALVAS